MPHTIALAPRMVHKPCYYIGYPYVAVFINTQEWKPASWTKVVLVNFLGVSDFLERLGTKRGLVDKYRNLIFHHSSRLFWALLRGKGMREWFRVATSMVMRYYKYPKFWKMIFIHPLSLPWVIMRKIQRKHSVLAAGGFIFLSRAMTIMR